MTLNEAKVLNRAYPPPPHTHTSAAPVTCYRVPEVLSSSHLLAGKQLSLVLVDNGVTCGHTPVLVPGHRTLEISRVGKTIGSCKAGKVTVTNGITDAVPSVRLFLFRPLESTSAGSWWQAGSTPWWLMPWAKSPARLTGMVLDCESELDRLLVLEEHGKVTQEGLIWNQTWSP